MPPAKSKKKASQPPTTATAATTSPNWPALRPLVPSSDLYIDTILPDQIYTIRNFFTANLCKAYVSFLSSAAISLTTTPLKPKSKYEAVRVNDRYQIEDAGFAELLWSTTALKELVSERRGLEREEEEEGEEERDAERRVWGGTPLGLNSNIRIYRYTPGQFFAQHCEFFSFLYILSFYFSSSYEYSVYIKLQCFLANIPAIRKPNLPRSKFRNKLVSSSLLTECQTTNPTQSNSPLPNHPPQNPSQHTPPGRCSST